MDQALLNPAAWKILQSMTGPDFLGELIDVYLGDSPALIEQMRGGLAAGSAETVRLEGHTKTTGRPILIDEATRCDLGGALCVEDCGLAELPGIIGPVAVYSVSEG